VLMISWVLGYTGFAMLAVSQVGNWVAVGGGAPISRQGMMAVRCAGWALLAAGLPAAVREHGSAFGTVLWIVSLSFSAFAVAMTLTWKAAWLRPLTRSTRWLCRRG
jgi:hypothetical protein